MLPFKLMKAVEINLESEICSLTPHKFQPKITACGLLIMMVDEFNFTVIL